MEVWNNPLSKIVSGLNEIESQHKKIDRWSSLDYDIDGLVYKVNNKFTKD